MVVGLAVLVWNVNSGSVNVPYADVADSGAVQTQPMVEQKQVVDDPQPTARMASANPENDKPVKQSNLSPSEVQRIVNAVDIRRGPKQVNPVQARYLPGEESYIRTINDLEQSVSVQNASLSASGQVAYAKDIAVVDDSIKKMREVVKKNPRNQAARQILYSTYQDKIDLLKASAGRGEMMASLQ